MSIRTRNTFPAVFVQNPSCTNKRNLYCHTSTAKVTNNHHLDEVITLTESYY